MSIHPSLSTVSKSKQHRSVLKRFERISILEKQVRWKEGSSVFGLPKVKSIKVRVKKEKTQAEAAPTATGASTGGATPQAAPKVAPKAAPKEETKPKK